MATESVTPWRWVTQLDESDGRFEPILSSLDAYRDAWEEFVRHLSPDEFAKTRRASLRRHAIETGIIERLYDVSWGVTEALVAEGLTRDVVERVEGDLDEDDLTTIRTQFEALELVAEAAREKHELTKSFIKLLHEAITRNQLTYRAHDRFGRAVELQLRHGQWKLRENHVRRDDGSLLQYTPHEHVEAETDRLVEFFAATEGEHAILRAAWLHHAFISIHPFEDGNGRVARALVLLVLLRDRWAPLVVDRARRSEYLSALDSANQGDLAQLVRFFADLERLALVSELQRPLEVPAVGSTPVEVARGSAVRIRKEQVAADEARASAVALLAADVQARVHGELSRLGEELRDAFAEIDPSLHHSVLAKSPPEPEARYWYEQLVRAARGAQFFANIVPYGSWWVRLRLVVLGQELRYVVATQKVGHGETGVLAVTVFAELVSPRVEFAEGDEERQAAVMPLLNLTSEDAVTLNHTENVEDRWSEVCDLIERTLAAAVAEYGRQLG